VSKTPGKITSLIRASPQKVNEKGGIKKGCQMKEGETGTREITFPDYIIGFR
jgi:hypothetical protein